MRSVAHHSNLALLKPEADNFIDQMAEQFFSLVCIGVH